MARMDPILGRRTQLLSVAVSRHAVLALNAEGMLLYAQVKRGCLSTPGIVELRPLTELEGMQFREIATRFGQAFAINDAGEVYAWGMRSGDSTRQDLACSMGFGDVRTQLTPAPLPAFGPGRARIWQVACGITHTLFLSIEGEVFGVGRNDYGKLGMGHARLHVLHPDKMERSTTAPPVPVRGVAAGAQHSLVVAANGSVWGCGAAQQGSLPMRACVQSPGLLSVDLLHA
jgi:alpha-tubulin suppressor-like RCC1 family protein